MDNTASVERYLVRGPNGCVGLILLPDQYAHIFDTTFIRLTKLGREATILASAPTGEEQRLLR